MSAEAVPMDSGDNSLPRWLIPPPGGWRAEDLDRLPSGAPRHIELIDGGLVVMAPQGSFHMRVINALLGLLSEQAPDGLEVAREMTVRIDERQRPEPDLLVLDRSVLDQERTWVAPEDVHLVIEVLSPESEVRDTHRKPQLYAGAGIRHFWRVENDGGRPVIFTYELDGATRGYLATGIHRDAMSVSTPFPIKLQVDTLREWRRLRLS
jgi:Uma2 family endonuclease